MVWNFVVNCSDPFSLLYLLSSDNSATHLPSVWSWKGCLLWPLAFDLKATKLSWILKYFTCSPSTCNSYVSQNNGLVGSLHELIQKSETYRPKIMSDLESCQWTLQCSSTLVLDSLNGGFRQASDFSWRKVPRWKKKTLHLDTKRQTWCWSCRQGAPQESIFSRKRR